MVRSRWIPVVLLTAAVAAVPLVLLVPGMQTGALFLAPAMVLLASLLTGRYVGETGLDRLVAAVRRRAPSRAPAQHRARPARPRALMPRGGNLVATSLAVRPPPLLQAAR
jgi:hypothetical protein